MPVPPALERVQVGFLGSSSEELSAEVRAAEAAGVDGVWAPEIFRSSITQAAWIAASSERVGVGTAIAWAFTRSPFILAISAMDLDEMSGGRFRLGLGAGVRRLNERWHGVEYGRPAPHLKETIEAVREIIAGAHEGQPITYSGEYQQLEITGWVRPMPAVRERIPIYAAAVNAGMGRMAGDVADGLLGHSMCSPRWLAEVLIPAFEKGLKRSGRSRGDFDFLPSICVAIDDDEGRAMEAARRCVAFYTTVRTYHPLLEIHGFSAEAEAVAQAFRQGDLEGAVAAVTDEMVDVYCAAGPLDKVREKVAPVAELGDGLFLAPPPYFLPAEQVAEYQRGILEHFGPTGEPARAL